MRLTLTTLALLLFCGQVHAQTTILFEDFETAGSARTGVTYTGPADATADIAAEDYYGVLNTGSGADITYSNIQGTDFYGAQDTDGAVGGGGPLNPVVLNWTGIDVSGFTGLNLSWFVAEDTAGDGNEDWDITTSVQLEGSFDGFATAGIDLFAIESINATIGNRAPAVDTNFDGLGDGAAITDTFTQFSAAIADGTTLDLRLTIQNLDTGDEDIAFDSFLLTGIAAVPEPSGLAFLLIFGSTIGLRRRRKP